eukprot:TRINITY_DN41766_c0_g2_i1.p1 TRINITY_DN41766_c0_g2~~TRINITY_DN41766_c0_g2_i1.p1  ORF type:complete len:766 (-),score=110.26 TRINITY_DN41766_c0_g2_i1:119-2416(-)
MASAATGSAAWPGAASADAGDVDLEDVEIGVDAKHADLSTGILEAFYIMEQRRWRRVANGRARRHGLGTDAWYAFLFLILWLLICRWFDIDFTHYRQYVAVPVFITVMLVLATIWQSIQAPEQPFAYWFSTEVYIFVLWMAWFYDPMSDDPACDWLSFWNEECRASERWQAARGLLISLFAGLLVATAILFVAHRYLLPVMLRGPCRGCASRYWWRVRLESIDKTNAQGLTARMSYNPSGVFSGRRAEFSWQGGVDDHGRPHGMGCWGDTSFHGECLRGVWIHGVPGGEFTSREYGTGAQFKQLPIGYATSRADCMPENLSKKSSVAKRGTGLRFGLAQVEVSYAGGFFPFLPSVEQHAEQQSLTVLLRSRQQTVTSKDLRKPYISIEGIGEDDLAGLLAAADDTVQNNVIISQLPVYHLTGSHIGFAKLLDLHRSGAMALMERKPEALIFLHGYNSDLATSMGRVAQVFALGNMPPHIVPFVFSYSGGSALMYFQVKWHMVDYGKDFAIFLEQLGEHFTETHILTHSCGAEFFFVNWNDISDRFVPACCGLSRQSISPAPPRRDPNDRRLHLATLTLLNADVLLEIVARLLPEILQHAEHFSSYNDSTDGALFYSAMMQSVLPRPLQKWRAREDAAWKTQVFGRCVSPLWMDLDEGGQPVLQSADIREALGLERKCQQYDAASVEPQLETGRHWTRRMDIIDCSGIDQNVHKLRHNYYMLNTQMVEDVCELVGSRRTACGRRGLVQADGNVFSFLAPPGHLISD